MQIIMNTNFIKVGTTITPVPEGIDYTLLLDKAYKLFWNDWENQAYLNEVDLPVFPEHCYTGEMDKFINKVLNTFNTTDKNTTGVLLSGMKGSGKTLTAKRLALKSGVPIIIVNEQFPANRLTTFFSKVQQEVCILFDEIDKNTRYWDTKLLLSFLDGIEGNCKKLVIFTCNDVNFANENLIDRCSRIRYYKIFEELTKDRIEEIVDDLLQNKSKKDEILNCVESITTKSYDNIIALVTEVNNNPKDSISELFNDLNVACK